MSETKEAGRPVGSGWSKLDHHQKEIEELIQNGATKVFIAKKFNFTTAGLYAWMMKNKISLRPIV
jgi:hypothetical protein